MNSMRAPRWGHFFIWREMKDGFLKDQPKILTRKVVMTALVGIGCLLVGGAYFLCSKWISP
jgi:hypothetical protein